MVSIRQTRVSWTSFHVDGGDEAHSMQIRKSECPFHNENGDLPATDPAVIAQGFWVEATTRSLKIPCASLDQPKSVLAQNDNVFSFFPDILKKCKTSSSS